MQVCWNASLVFQQGTPFAWRQHGGPCTACQPQAAASLSRQQRAALSTRHSLVSNPLPYPAGSTGRTPSGGSVTTISGSGRGTDATAMCRAEWNFAASWAAASMAAARGLVPCRGSGCRVQGLGVVWGAVNLQTGSCVAKASQDTCHEALSNNACNWRGMQCCWAGHAVLVRGREGMLCG